MKKSFTLIEVLISIVIFVFVYYVMSNVISYLNGSEKFIKNIYLKETKKQKLIKTLYSDILESKTIKITKINKNSSILDIVTYNSLYDFSLANVQWKINTHNQLVRMEGISKIKKDDIDYIDNFSKVKIFRVFKNKNQYFIFIKFQDNKETFFKVKGIK